MADAVLERGDHSASETPFTDAALLAQYRRGESQAATELYRRYSERLRSLAQARTGSVLSPRLDSSDIVQSVFRTFFRRAAEGEYSVPEGEELWNLFLVIGLNKIRAAGRHHRAAKRDARRTVAESDIGAGLAITDDQTAMDVLRITIEELLVPFPESSRDVIRLRIEGCDVAEIATRTKRAKRSVERILQEFRGILQGQLHDGH